MTSQCHDNQILGLNKSMFSRTAAIFNCLLAFDRQFISIVLDFSLGGQKQQVICESSDGEIDDHAVDRSKATDVILSTWGNASLLIATINRNPIPASSFSFQTKKRNRRNVVAGFAC